MTLSINPWSWPLSKANCGTVKHCCPLPRYSTQKYLLLYSIIMPSSTHLRCAYYMQVVTIVVNGVRHIPYRSPTTSCQRQVLQKPVPLLLKEIQCLISLLLNILFVTNRQGQLLPVQYELSKSNRDRDLLIQQAKELQETQVLSLTFDGVTKWKQFFFLSIVLSC